MAVRKSNNDVLKSEKYMDDAAFEIFLNLHKAAKRKNDYIWSTNKFNFLDSIWGDPKEDSAKNLDTKPDCKDSKVHCSYYIAQSPNKTHEQHITGKTASENCGMKWNTTERCEVNLQNELGRTEKSEQINSAFESKMTFPNLSKRSIDSNINCISKNKPRCNRLQENYITAEEESKRNYKKHIGKEISPSKLNVMDRNGKKLHDPINEQAVSNVKSFNIPIEKPLDVRAKVIGCQSSNFSPKCNIQVEESTAVTYTMKAMDRNVEMKLHDSDKSNKDNLRFQEKINNSQTENNMLKLLSVKINSKLPFRNNNPKFEFIVNLANFKHILKKFPKLQETLPHIDAGEKEIDYDAKAVNIVFGSLFNPPYNFNETPEGRTAVETLAAAKSWDMKQFYSKLKKVFLEKLPTQNFEFVYPAAKHYGLSEIYKACKLLFPHSKTEQILDQRRCSVSVSTYIEPREFPIPLEITNPTLDDNFDRDVRNEIIFEAIEGDYIITGFHILLNTENINSNSKQLDIFYSVKNMTEESEKEEGGISKPLRRTIAVHFKKKLTILEKQKAKISVETSIKPYLCFAIRESIINEKCDGEFVVNMTSTYKVRNSNGKRFLIGRLLYYPKTGELT